MNTDTIVIKTKSGLLQLAKKLGNVPEAFNHTQGFFYPRTASNQQGLYYVIFPNGYTYSRMQVAAWQAPAEGW